MTLMAINPDVLEGKRGCGFRVNGGAYSCLGVGAGGRPLYTFLLDPPKLLPEDFKLAAVGITPLKVINDGGNEGRMTLDENGNLIIDSFSIDAHETRAMALTALGEGTDWTPPIIKNAVIIPAEFAEKVQISAAFQKWEGSACYHFFDWVGEAHYPFVSDFIEEAHHFIANKRIAISRRFALNIGLITKITPRHSKHILVHPKAFIENQDDFYDEDKAADGWSRSWTCPTHNHRHEAGQVNSQYFVPHCLGLAWSAVEGTPLLPDAQTDFEQRKVRREHGSAVYYGLRPPTGSKPLFKPAAFMAFRLNRIQFVAKDEATVASKMAELAALRSQGLEVEIVSQ